MSLNYKEIDAVLTELDADNSFIQSIVQPGYDSIVFYLYKKSYKRSKAVFISLAPNECRIHETRRSIQKHKTPLRFMEFLKSRIQGAKIAYMRQIDNERIICAKIVQAGQIYTMFIRLWSGAANIIVTDETLCILDLFYRRPKRGEVCGKAFCLPDAKNQDNRDEKQKNAGRYFEKRDFSAPEYADFFAQCGIDGANLPFNEQLDI